MTKFKYSVTCQSTIFFEETKIKAANSLIQFSKIHKNIARFIGFPIVTCYSLLGIAEGIAAISEAIIKGIGNLFAFPFIKDASFLKGIKQLVVQFPIHAIDNVLLLPIKTAFSLLFYPLAMVVVPVDVLEKQKENIEIFKQSLDFVSDRKNKILLPQINNAYNENEKRAKLTGYKLMYF